MKPVERWVQEVEKTVRPERVVWCDGSALENEKLVEQMVGEGTLQRLDEREAPGCTLHRSHPTDVARTEHLTFIASRSKAEAGPTNNWMSPDDARAKVGPLFDGVMKGRTMYVVPYVMGPLGSRFSKVGVEVTDSPYVVANMRIMTRMGQAALDELGASEDFVPGLHSTGDFSPTAVSSSTSPTNA
jgi:phosphoenolpyruvate carboxykinase (GTP)